MKRNKREREFQRSKGPIYTTGLWNKRRNGNEMHVIHEEISGTIKTGGEVSWIRTRVSFEVMRSVHLCVRGSRVPFKKRDETDMLEDFRLNVHAVGIV